MNKKIAIIDYGMGNLGSVANSMRVLGVQVHTTNRLQELEHADAYILPGVGAFHRAMENFKKLNLPNFLKEQVLERQKPILGICLGMQLLALDSEEDGLAEGLGWIDAHVVKIKEERELRVPHVGWNNLESLSKTTLLENIEDNAHFYFDHSYHFVANDDSVVKAVCHYGKGIASVVQRGHIFATQFHPEKSQRNGLKLLRNFINFTENCLP